MVRETSTGGRLATTGVIPGAYALSVGNPRSPLPDGWEWTQLTDVARLESGHTPSRRHPEYWGGSVPWIGIRDATGNHGQTIYKTEQQTNDLGISNSSARILPTDTVCLSRTASVGYVVMMGVPMATSQDFVNWVCGERLNPHFLKYILLLENPSFAMFSMGTTHQTIYFPEVKAFHIAMPCRSVQDDIVEILGALDEKIDLNRRMNETLETMARATFRDWFVDFGPTRAKIAACTPYLSPEIWNLFPDRLDDKGVPDGWTVETLKALCSKSNGHIRTGPFGSQLHQSDYTSDGTPVVMPINLSSGEIFTHGIARIGPELARKLSHHAMEEGDIVYGRRGDIGRKALVGPDESGWICGTGCLRISLRSERCPPIYLFHHLDRPDIRNWIATRAIGATMPNLNTGILGEVEILVPNESLIAKVKEIFEPILDQIRANRKEIQILGNSLNFLLAKLIGDKVEVNCTMLMSEEGV